ncbi:hypothetical protein BB559_002251 [Furculomyces boomerangus]|uniref:Uncharacterized protein n=2 Tax=Harpellales TaxID=61421 RepID=A0A2T9YWX6_9FUNG|nr:hypothetical protein BB559_002251 [Furculomyces boomerangus]PVZ98120.1 hypothetical protein BB558_005884 [Smittium angustum]
MENSCWNYNEIISLHMNPYPFIILTSHIKIPRSINYIPNLLILMQMLLEKRLQLRTQTFRLLTKLYLITTRIPPLLTNQIDLRKFLIVRTFCHRIVHTNSPQIFQPHISPRIMTCRHIT